MHSSRIRTGSALTNCISWCRGGGVCMACRSPGHTPRACTPPPVMHAPRHAHPSGHTLPRPCMPPRMHSPQPHTPPAIYAPWACMPPAMHAPGMNAPQLGTTPPGHIRPPSCPCMPPAMHAPQPRHAHPPGTYAPQLPPATTMHATPRTESQIRVKTLPWPQLRCGRYK